MATITVGTNSYVTEAELTTYVTDRGVSLTGTPAVLLIQAMDWLESQPFTGGRYDLSQSLEFPRDFIAFTYETLSEVPLNIKKAQMVAAVIIDDGGTLLGPVERAVKREKVDVLETEYMDNTSESTQYPELNLLLRGYIASGFMVSRG